MTAVGWDETGWDDDEPTTPAVPAYYCEDDCCRPPVRRPGLLARLLDALRPTPKDGRP